MPSFTFVSTANAVVAARRRRPSSSTSAPTRSTSTRRSSSAAITAGTKAIVPVHYAGVGVRDGRRSPRSRAPRAVRDRGRRAGLLATYAAGRSGASATLGALSFHETKNVMCGEGGALLVNDARLRRARRDHPGEGHRPAAASSAARSTSTRGSTSARSYPPSEINAAFLWAQLEQADEITGATARDLGAPTTTPSPSWSARGACAARSSRRVRRTTRTCTTSCSRASRRGPRSSRASTSAAMHAVFHYVPLHSSAEADTRDATATRGDRGAERPAGPAAAVGRDDGPARQRVVDAVSAALKDRSGPA